MQTEKQFPQIAALVPHAAPMLLLDRVISVDADKLCAQVAIVDDSLFLTGTGTGVGAWVGIEYMAQAIAAWAGYHAQQRGEAVRIGFLLGSRRYDASVPYFATGSTLHVEVEKLLQADNGLGSFACSIRDADSQQQLAQATISVFQPHDAGEFLQESPQ
ncbi:3-hydroxylacyl-ACP dehydratase [Herbaspirillum lusitanum]|uniref:hotdog family protein n=1 Tax=Herbaspirillum lusitanum TaxID=213312 RepID=UPI0022382BCE|nr:hotdog family protein [Herbaspirillum lusitanum]MCW5299975.1 3-hydroxylacyl-ACP dehydratase [Herbaspirillum lusitanum]